ncbi:MAG: cytochrome c [Gammaproteobacteria bacterium]|nr:cytochrome c [Gammaproteobacteria bacterium]MDH4310549.1 cytochrome c [Gammaproteobacteria bacterium]MDH5271670.1 cytochrome c [Gammaproteobacteria bacterium]
MKRLRHPILPRVLAAALPLLTAAALPALAAEGSTPDLEAGRRTFDSVCAACHGPTGHADPENPTVKALDPQPADLSDPLFNSREPAEDWRIVVTHGGQALGLSATMPAQGAALNEQQIRDVVAYAKTLAPGSEAYPPGELNFFLPIRTKKAFPEDEIVWKSRLTDRDGADVWRNVLEVEKRFGKRSMGVVELVHEDDGTDSEITEVEVGAKTVLHWNLARRSILSGAVVVAFPTDGDASEEIIPYLAYGRLFAERWMFQSSARLILPVDDVDMGEAEFAAVVHYRWTQWPRRVFPALEFTATAPFDDGGGDSMQWTVLPQLRFGLTRGAHVALSVGAEIPLSDQSYDTRWHLSLLWDFADGSFFKGWR